MSPILTLDRRPCFVVSTGRCGSKMMARVLDVHPAIAAYHEPRPHLNTEAYLRWSDDKGSEYVHDRLGQKRDGLISQAGAQQCSYVESSHFMSHLIPEIYERYGACFVHLYRDGRQFIRSGLERGWYEKPGIGGRVKTWIRRSLGVPIGFSFRDHRLDPPSDMTTRFDKIAWLWVEINRAILEALDRLPETDVMEVRLEAFGPKTIRRLLAFVGHKVNSDLLARMRDVAERRPNRTENRTVPPAEDWGPTKVERFWKIAGNMMRRLNYDE